MVSVITSINSPTSHVRLLGSLHAKTRDTLLVIGDRKSPAVYEAPGVMFMSVEKQLELPFQFTRLCPENTYARKNIGYLTAIKSQSEVIYETDDDTGPLLAWHRRQMTGDFTPVMGPGWSNVYSLFNDSGSPIWPRGFPLRYAQTEIPLSHLCSEQKMQVPIQQGLVDASPDVDAVWRLAHGKGFGFTTRPSVMLCRDAWCPFNSQNTWWWPPAYPLMYLPAYSTFRMSNIWRSLIAQRCLWEMDMGVGFHSADVYQTRNPHDLMADFEQEIPGYRHNEAIAEMLGKLQLSPRPKDVGANMLKCYEAMNEAKFLPPAELTLVTAWLDDLQHMGYIYKERKNE